MTEEDDGRRAAYTIPSSGALNTLIASSPEFSSNTHTTGSEKVYLDTFSPLLQYFDTELVRNRDKSRKQPIHIASRIYSPVEVLALLLELDTAQLLHRADQIGALPLLEC